MTNLTQESKRIELLTRLNQSSSYRKVKTIFENRIEEMEK